MHFAKAVYLWVFFLDSHNKYCLFRIRLANVLVGARANIKQQTWTVGPFQELKRSSVNFGQIFYFSFSKETEANYEEEETYLE